MESKYSYVCTVELYLFYICLAIRQQPQNIDDTIEPNILFKKLIAACVPSVLTQVIQHTRTRELNPGHASNLF